MVQILIVVLILCASAASQCLAPANGGLGSCETPAVGKVPISDGTKYVPGDPLVQGISASGSTAQPNPVMTGVWDGAALRATLGDSSGRMVVNVNGNVGVTGTFWQSVQPVSGTFWQSTQPVSIAAMPSTPVTGTFWQATQPVSGSVGVSNFPASQAVTGTFWQATQPVSIAATVPISLGNATGKTNVMKTGSLATTAVTADQVVLTYTVTAGKTLYITYLDIDARLTTFATTATYFGLASLESPAGTKLITQMKAGSGVTVDPHYEFSEPIPIAAGTVIRVVCTPSTTTSYTWQASFGGYEK